MKKNFFLLLLVIILASCNDQIDNTELEPIASSTFQMNYPMGMGSSGDTINGLLGYGYDVTGFCDTISVKAKVFDTLPDYNKFYGNPNSTFQTLVNGASFEELVSKISNPYFSLGSAEVFSQHLKSLLKLTNNSNSVDSNYAFTYYAITYINSHRKFYTNSDNQQYLSTAFKDDVVTLSPQELISKYGTHVITDLYTGTKFEVLYGCKFSKPTSGTICENMFYNRMKEFIGGTPGISNDFDTNTKYSQSDEVLIYNSIGSREKLCGVIYTTDYNPESIQLNISSIFNEENLNTQFITVGTDGILPIYELINNESKKQEVKGYIENYMSNF